MTHRARNPFPYPTYHYSGSSGNRQRVGLPGHCELCDEVGHIVKDVGLDFGLDKIRAALGFIATIRESAESRPRKGKS